MLFKTSIVPHHLSSVLCQLRINVECSFGMLVNRWGLLRRALPSSVGLERITALVMCMCKLHNFCIDCRLDKERIPSIPEVTAKDNACIVTRGGFRLQSRVDNPYYPEELLHGGEHFDDFTASEIKEIKRRMARTAKQLPRDMMLEMVERKGLQRLLPEGWVSANADGNESD